MNREKVLERKATFVKCLSLLIERFPEFGIKSLEYRASDTGGEYVDIHWIGGVIRAANVTADSLPAIVKDLSKHF